MLSYLKKHLPDPDKFYFDYGTRALDAGYENFQLRVDEISWRRPVIGKNSTGSPKKFPAVIIQR
jgi:hypothetical protein